MMQLSWKCGMRHLLLQPSKTYPDCFKCWYKHYFYFPQIFSFPKYLQLQRTEHPLWLHEARVRIIWKRWKMTVKIPCAPPSITISKLQFGTWYNHWPRVRANLLQFNLFVEQLFMTYNSTVVPQLNSNHAGSHLFQLLHTKTLKVLTHLC